MKTIVLIDGEHYPPVISQTLKNISSSYDVVGGVFLGGTEKIGEKKELDELVGIPLVVKDSMLEAVKAGLNEFEPEVVLDLSDEPVVGYRERFKIASLVIKEGVEYKGSDFHFLPPLYKNIAKKPSLTIAGTGKRVGKTAIGAYTARFIDGKEIEMKKPFSPCIITMGRGGPENPEVIPGDNIQMNPDYFLKQVSMGKHAASDHYEDALMSRVKTIGCRRCGGGFSGKPFYDIVEEGAKIANDSDNDFLIFEGSGATNPPIKTDSCIMTIGAHQPIEYIGGYMGPLRIMMADLIILTMCEEPMASDEKVEEMVRIIRDINPNVSIVKTVFRPKPLGKIKGKNIIFCTTAPSKIEDKLKKYLKQRYECNIVGITHQLSNRGILLKELEKMIQTKNVDSILTEVKAASIDVATKFGMEQGREVIYVDNLPVTVGKEQSYLEDSILKIMNLTIKRFNNG